MCLHPSVHPFIHPPCRDAKTDSILHKLPLCLRLRDCSLFVCVQGVRFAHHARPAFQRDRGAVAALPPRQPADEYMRCAALILPPSLSCALIGHHLAQILLAVGEASGRKESQSAVWRKVTADEYMRCAVLEAYQSLRPFLLSVVEPSRTGGTTGTAAAATQEAGSGVYEARIINRLFDDLEVEGNNGSLLTTFRFSALPVILDRLSKLTAVLVSCCLPCWSVVACPADYCLDALFQQAPVVPPVTIFVSPKTSPPASFTCPPRASLEDVSGKPQSYCLFAAVAWPANRAAVKRLHLLLTIKESAMDVPHNLEARRRLQFFTNSLHMRMPDAPKVADTLPFWYDGVTV
ncbi:unnamed protein product, partial [Closterium sp. NIES-54]